MLTTIQINQAEEKMILELKKEFDFPTKKAVVMAALKHLQSLLEERKRVARLQKASLKVRASSLEVNKDFQISLTDRLKDW